MSYKLMLYFLLFNILSAVSFVGCDYKIEADANIGDYVNVDITIEEDDDEIAPSNTEDTEDTEDKSIKS